ncbi:unnamed protein product [Rhizophagus irregularis]|nr:unnamed protein product [Rhizophagus irregularis]
MEPSKINNTHSKDENINEEDKVTNKVNTVTLNDFSDVDSGVYEDIILNQTHGGFSTVYKGLWLDGLIEQWDYEKQDWKRSMYKDENYHCNSENYGFLVAIKSLNDSANITEDFLNEVSDYSILIIKVFNLK